MRQSATLPVVTENVVIRSTAPVDERAVLELVRAAFSDASRDGQEEVDIVSRT